MSKTYLQSIGGIILILLFFTLFFLLQKNNHTVIAPTIQNQIISTTTPKVTSVTKEKENAVTIGNVKIKVDVADTPLKQSQGLSGRAELKEGEGMFFIFEKPAHYSFWMKDMNFPIDIIWIDENYQIVDIKHSLSPETYPNTVSPKTSAQYVLEVPAGFSQKNNIVEKSTIKINF
jgi:uncharacterized membrane protein (UPF0127 family)